MTYVHEKPDADLVREALHTLTAVSLKEDVDAAEIHENSLEGYAALSRLEARIEEVESISFARETKAAAWQGRAEAAEARIERLEGALREIEFGSVLRLGGRANLSREEMQQIARAALAEEPYADVPGAGQRGC